MSEIRALCKHNTSLSEEDITVIEQVAGTLQIFANIANADIFLDCPAVGGDAIVIAEAKPSNVLSSYKKTVVGMLARQENEPAVARTFQLGVATKQVKALTQESTHVVQSVEPIRNGGQVIGVLIVEKRIEDQPRLNGQLHFTQQSYDRIVNALTHMVMLDENNWLTECIDEALIMVNHDGLVSFRNSLAQSLYAQLGFMEDALGQPYENFRLTDNIPVKDEGYSVVEAEVGKRVLCIKYIRLDESDVSFAVFIRDITDIREKEKELILKSVAIKEMHHRIKNNLQTVASLLRLQARRSDNEETRQVLGESMNRILSIATTHELLAQSGVDCVKIGEVILNIKNNTVRHFARPNFDVNVRLEGDDFEVESDLATSVALIINELLQNSLEYAFKGRDKGIVRIIVEKGELYSQIQVIDDGKGFDVTKVGKDRLGLSIVKALVNDKLRGRLTIESGANGTKTLFSFINRLASYAT